MARPAPVAQMTYAEYVASEAASDARHEFLKGEVFAMAGGTPTHGALAVAMAAELRTALRDKPCRIYSSDVRVRIQATSLTTYPDLSVVCGSPEVDEQDPNALVNPVLLVEVLSDATEAYDRGAKAAHFRRLPSLREYVLVSQQEALIEIHRRNDRGVWEIHEAREGQRLLLLSLGVEIEVNSVYRDALGSLLGAT